MSKLTSFMFRILCCLLIGDLSFQFDFLFKASILCRSQHVHCAYSLGLLQCWKKMVFSVFSPMSRKPAKELLHKELCGVVGMCICECSLGLLHSWKENRFSPVSRQPAKEVLQFVLCGQRQLSQVTSYFKRDCKWNENNCFFACYQYISILLAYKGSLNVFILKTFVLLF